MDFTPSFYHGKVGNRSFFERVRSHFGLLVLIVIVAVSLYSIINLSKYGRFFGKTDYDKINLIDLLSYGNLHSGKNICTEGFYVKTKKLAILKVSLNEDQYTRSAWVKTAPDQEIITEFPGLGDRYVRAAICGYFESARNGEFGDPPVFNHQITVSSYKTLGDTLPLEKTF